jgi:leukotriene-A4 hydrolase
LAAEETIVTPYQFGVYDLLVLPPSFPYGGMVRDIWSLMLRLTLRPDRKTRV